MQLPCFQAGCTEVYAFPKAPFGLPVIYSSVDTAEYIHVQITQLVNDMAVKVPTSPNTNLARMVFPV
jgi:hypothetical protein